MDEKYVLGINVGFHDAAAALVGSGRLLSLIEQERLSRKKHAVAETPALAVKRCLSEAGIRFEDVAEVAIGWDLPRTALGKSRRFAPARLGQMLFGELDLSPQDASRAAERVVWVDHHLAHAASAYYSLGADVIAGGGRAAILIVDGAGEHCATTLALGEGRDIRVLQQWPIEQSLGFYYSSATRWAGLGEFGEGKLMGLASYGRPHEESALDSTEDGYQITVAGQPMSVAAGIGSSHALLLSLFPAFEAAVTPAFQEMFPYAPRKGEGAIAYADFAASAQRSLERVMLRLATIARERTSATTLVLAGGVAMNCSMIGRLLRAGIFQRVYVPPVPTDVGVALGAALARAATMEPFLPTAIDHAYWSASLGEHEPEFERTWRQLGLFARALTPAQLPALVARAIASGKIVGWARGRGEIGERALGARSILADPRSRESLERLNLLKGREMWRPVAPSVLRENYSDVMMGPAHDPMHFMLAADLVRPDMRRVVPAITHVDGTARPQVVDEHSNPTFHRMLRHFREITGVPLVTNTSFNLADEPIVSGAADAARTFARGIGFDLLVVGDTIFAKDERALQDCERLLDSTTSST